MLAEDKTLQRRLSDVLARPEFALAISPSAVDAA